jgi:hypothetical protein
VFNRYIPCKPYRRPRGLDRGARASLSEIERFPPCPSFTYSVRVAAFGYFTFVPHWRITLISRPPCDCLAVSARRTARGLPQARVCLSLRSSILISVKLSEHNRSPFRRAGPWTRWPSASSDGTGHPLMRGKHRQAAGLLAICRNSAPKRENQLPGSRVI